MIEIANSEVTLHNLYDFCMRIKKDLPTEISDIPVSFKVLLIPHKCNALVRIRISHSKSIKKATIIVNLLPFICNRFSSDILCYFFVYVSIMHEVEHIRLLTELRENEQCDYHRFFAGLEQMFARNIRIRFRNISTYRIKELLSTQKKRYETSTAELICDYESISLARKQFYSHLSENELRQIDDILKSLSLLIHSIEIGYLDDGKPCNQFLLVLSSLQRRIRKDNGILAMIPQLSKLFKEDGTLKPIEEIVKKSYNSGICFYDDFLIRLFIILDYDWHDIFRSQGQIKEYMQRISNYYCAKCCSFLSQLDLSEIYLKKEIVSDNAAMLIKNMTRLNSLMKQYGLKNTSGMVLPLYKVYQ